MSNTPEKLPITSQIPLEERLKALQELIPEAFSEGKIDFNKLRNALGDGVDSGSERYGISWAGKSEAIRAVQIPSRGTLEPIPDKSVNFDSSQNLIIEGDNLEVLKLLQKSYYGKIKMIYIDPPYNTGNEFIYPDNFREGLEDYLVYSGQRSDNGTRLSSSEEKGGRKHSRWLNMMYPRLFLARNLLKEDGVIFVSIDDNEVKNLRALMDEVFGEDNFIASLVWQKSKKGDSKLISRTHEYVIVFGRDVQSIISQGNWRIGKEGVDSVLTHYDSLVKQYSKDHDRISDEMRKWFKKLPDDDSQKQHQHYRWSDDRGLYFAADFAGPDDGRESRPRYDIIHPITNQPCKKPSTGWRWDKERTKKALLAKPPLIHFGIDETTIPCRKVYLKDTNLEPFFSVFYRDGRAGTLEVEKLLGKGLFDFPKNTDVIQGFASLIGDEESIILDFFAGSGTTAQAVLELNKEDGGNRKFILVQLPEKTGREDYPTITDITLERTRRVIKKLNDAENGSLGLNDTPDRGFKAFTLRASNFKVWDGNAEGKTPEELEEQLTLFAHNLEPNESDEQGILFEIILKSGLPLTVRILVQELNQKVYAIEGKTLYICLAQPIEPETLAKVIEAKPEKFVCLDAAFAGNDQLKTNTLLQMRNAGITFYTV